MVVGAQECYIQSHNELFPKSLLFLKFPPIKNSPASEKKKKFFTAKNKFIARIGNKKNKNFIFKLTSHKITISKRFQTSLALINCSLTKVLLQFTNINFKTFSWNSLTVLQNINLDFREVYPLTAKSHEFSWVIET